MKIPFLTLPTYICPIPGKPNIPPRKAINAVVPGLLYGNCSTIRGRDSLRLECSCKAEYTEWHLGHSLVFILASSFSPQLLQKFGPLLICRLLDSHVYKEKPNAF